VLEAVEVEQHEHQRLGRRGLRQPALEHARQRAPVAEPGQRVGRRLLARRAQHRDVVAEREHRARHHRQQRRGGEPDRHEVEPGHASVHEQRQPAGAEAQRHDDPAQALVGHDRGRGARRLPRRGADRQHPEPPAGVEPAARHVTGAGVGHEVLRVGEPEQRRAGEQQHPGAVEPPAGRRERPDDHAEQHEVHQRVGEADRDLERPARRVLLDGLEDQRRAGRAHGERSGDPVRPQRARHLARAAAQQRDHAGQQQRREQEVAGVGRRRDRDLLRRPQDRRVVDLAERPGCDRRRDQQPGATLGTLAPGERGPAAQQRGHEQDDVVREAAEQRAGAEAEQHVRLPQHQPGRDEQPGSAAEGASLRVG
jgi:hypothetical protein